MKGRDKERWLILIIVYLSILSFAFLFQSIPPILPLITSELRLNYAQSSLLMSLFALPGLFLSLLGGYLSDRYEMRSLGGICFLFMMVGILLVGFGNELWVLGTGRIFAGIGAFCLSVLLPKLLSQWFIGKELGFAMGIYNTGIPLGSVICFGLFGKMGHLWGWRFPIKLLAIYLLITSILFLIFYRLPLRPFAKNPKPSRFFKSLREMGTPILWISFSWLWFNAGFVSFATFSPPFFIEMGYSLENSGYLIGIPLFGSLFLSPLIGHLVDRLRHQEWLIGIGGLALSLLTILFNFSSSFLFIVIAMGIFSALIPSPVYSLPPEILKPENIGLGFGILSTFSSIGLFVAPYMVGRVRDITGSNDWSFIMISLFFLFVMVFILFAHLFRSPKNPVS